MQQPSKNWRSLKLAILDSLTQTIIRRVELLSIPYFAAVGFYLQGWLQVTVGGTGIATITHAAIVWLSILAMIVLAPTLLAMMHIVRVIQRRA